MKHYCSSENYLSIEEIDKILDCDSVNVIFYPNGDFYTIHAYLFDVFLGSSRSLRKIPTRSKFPRLFERVCLNRWIVERFGGKKNV